jgi:hypothetical protein
VYTSAESVAEHPNLSDTPVPGCISVNFKQPQSDRTLTINTRTHRIASAQTTAVCWVSFKHPGEGWRFTHWRFND